MEQSNDNQSLDNSPDVITTQRKKTENSQSNNSNKSSSNNNNDDRNRFFECNVCFDIVNEPVLTLCGHLFCWPCIYRWLEENPSCPVCKAGLTTKSIIPIYGRNSDGRCTEEDVTKKIPKRPQAQRQEYIPRNNRNNYNNNNPYFNPFIDGSGFHMSATVFPSLFGFHFQFPPIHQENNNNTFEQTPDQMRNAMISKILLTTGLMVFLFLFLL